MHLMERDAIGIFVLFTLGFRSFDAVVDYLGAPFKKGSEVADSFQPFVVDSLWHYINIEIAYFKKLTTERFIFANGYKQIF